MRDILFREKREDNGEWIEGVAFPDEDWSITIWKQNHIDGSLNGYEVDPASIGRYTGMTDKNGKKIFEGDICWFYGGEYYSGVWEHNAIITITDIADDEQAFYLHNAEYCEVISNIHDNPEMLKSIKEV